MLNEIKSAFELIDRFKKSKEAEIFDKVLTAIYYLGGSRSVELNEIKEETDFTHQEIFEAIEKGINKGYLEDSSTFKSEGKKVTLVLNGKTYVEGLLEE